MVDPDGLALRTAYEYDARGNRTAVIDANGARSEARYDSADRAVWMRDGEGYVTRIGYNGRGLRTGEVGYVTRGDTDSLPAGGLPSAQAQDRRSTYAYDAAGR